jgi:hypothetical protein
MDLVAEKMLREPINLGSTWFDAAQIRAQKSLRTMADEASLSVSAGETSATFFPTWENARQN